MDEKIKLFAFRRALYSISNKLTESDLQKMKFMLSDFLPRQQLERATSGFDLLCLMASKSDILSCDDYSFLEEVLREVGKGDSVESSFLASYSNPSLNIMPVGNDGAQHEKKLQVKGFLVELADHLTGENVRDLCQFFAGICESINQQNLHCVKSGEQLFSKLIECHLIGVGHLQPLQQVLSIIGRLDLASTVETFSSDMLQVDLSCMDHTGARGM